MVHIDHYSNKNHYNHQFLIFCSFVSMTYGQQPTEVPLISPLFPDHVQKKVNVLESVSSLSSPSFNH
jgi:hypothetical protein